MGLRDALQRDAERREHERVETAQAWQVATEALERNVAELMEVLREEGVPPRPYHLAEVLEVTEAVPRGLLRRADERPRTVEHAVYVGEGWTIVPGVETRPATEAGAVVDPSVVTESTIVLGADGGFARSVRWPGRGDVLRLAAPFVPVTDLRCPHGFTLDDTAERPRFVVDVAGRRLEIEDFFVLVVNHLTDRQRWSLW